MKDFQDYSLLSHNTFGIEARCRRYVEYESLEEARQVALSLAGAEEPLLLIGGGSNLLFVGDFPGTVLHSGIKGMGRQDRAETEEEVLLCCGSGETWDDVVAYCVAGQLYGAENLSLIPGEVGASAVQNIGAYGVEARQLIHSVETVEIGTGRVQVFGAEDCGYGYRQSRFKHEWHNRYLITHVTYRLRKTFEPRLEYGNIKAELQRRGIDTPTAAQLRQLIIDMRNEKLPDPKVQGNAGSFFMNPVVPRADYDRLCALYPGMPHYRVDEDHEKIPAGWLIEQCGWKGRTMGKAGVHDKQALVLVNRGGATGADILRLCETVREEVSRKFGIDIQAEVNVIGG